MALAPAWWRTVQALDGLNKQLRARRYGWRAEQDWRHPSTSWAQDAESLVFKFVEETSPQLAGPWQSMAEDRESWRGRTGRFIEWGAKKWGGQSACDDTVRRAALRRKRRGAPQANDRPRKMRRRGTANNEDEESELSEPFLSELGIPFKRRCLRRGHMATVLSPAMTTAG